MKRDLQNTFSYIGIMGVIFDEKRPTKETYTRQKRLTTFSYIGIMGVIFTALLTAFLRYERVTFE